MDCCVILNIIGNGLSCCTVVIPHFVIGISISDRNSLLISYEKLGKLNKFIKVMLCVSLIYLNINKYTKRNKLYID